MNELLDEVYPIERFEKWIETHVKSGVFPSKDEAYRILAYYAWSTYKWVQSMSGYTIYIRADVKPLTLEKIVKLRGDILDEEKMEENRREILEKLDTIIKQGGDEK